MRTAQTNQCSLGHSSETETQSREHSHPALTQSECVPNYLTAHTQNVSGLFAKLDAHHQQMNTNFMLEELSEHQVFWEYCLHHNIHVEAIIDWYNGSNQTASSVVDITNECINELNNAFDFDEDRSHFFLMLNDDKLEVGIQHWFAVSEVDIEAYPEPLHFIVESLLAYFQERFPCSTAKTSKDFNDESVIDEALMEIGYGFEESLNSLANIAELDDKKIPYVLNKAQMECVSKIEENPYLCLANIFCELLDQQVEFKTYEAMPLCDIANNLVVIKHNNPRLNVADLSGYNAIEHLEQIITSLSEVEHCYFDGCLECSGDLWIGEQFLIDSKENIERIDLEYIGERICNYGVSGEVQAKLSHPNAIKAFQSLFTLEKALDRLAERY